MNATLQVPWLKQLPSWLYKTGAQAWIDRKYPRHLFIETTAACNLRCGYCPRERRGDHMAWDLFTQLVDEATTYGPRSFSLHLFGEPLLYPRCAEACAYIKQRNRNHTILLTTNGTYLEQHCEWIIKSGIDQILWSWRPEATFIPETKEKLRRWGKFRVRFIAEITPKEAYEEWADWPNVEGRNLHTYGGYIDTSKWGVQKPSKRWGCYHLWYAPAVAWDGSILLCCADPKRLTTIGTFPQMSVAEAWKSPAMQQARKEHLHGIYKGICQNCDIWRQTPNVFFGHEYQVQSA